MSEWSPEHCGCTDDWTCSFHRTPGFDLDDEDLRDVKRVRFVPFEDDDEEEW